MNRFSLNKMLVMATKGGRWKVVSGCPLWHSTKDFDRSGRWVSSIWHLPEKAFHPSGSSLSASKETFSTRLVTFRPRTGGYRKRSLKHGGCRVKTDPLKEAGLRSRQVTGARTTNAEACGYSGVPKPSSKPHTATALYRLVSKGGTNLNQVSLSSQLCITRLGSKEQYE